MMLHRFSAKLPLVHCRGWPPGCRRDPSAFLLIAFAFWRFRHWGWRRPHWNSPDATEILKQRFARGDIDADELHESP